MRKQEKKPTIVYNPEFSAHGYAHLRWIECARCGLRRIGFADEILGLRHRGWFTHDGGDPSETYRGVVYQLPARDGKTLYVYGYQDPNENSALLSFDWAEDKEEAARNADRLADIFAEEARDYDRAWQAGQRYRELGEEIADMREEALAIGSEMRAARRTMESAAPTICATLRKKIMELYRRIQKTRRERADLLDNYGRADGFTG